MSEPLYSIIVPTFDRRGVLEEVLAAIEAQEQAPAFELLVVDDGSRDGTSELLDQRRFRVPSRVVHQVNRGPAAARNLGVALARGRFVAFLGDDTVPSRGWLRALDGTLRGSAAEAARARGEWVGVIGYTRWHPRMRLDPFLRYINEYGLQFGFALITDPQDVPFNFFYTSNLALDREALVEEPFDLGFPYAAWEDIEVSYRLKRRGFRLLYQASAVVDHDHPTSLARFCARQERVGYSGVVFHRRHPELGGFLGLGPAGPPPLPSRARQRILEGMARALQSLRVPILTPSLWETVLRYHYIAGLQRGWAEGAGLDVDGEPGRAPRGPGVTATASDHGGSK
jgi:glycosyltransferase involved in cell wall biosynthesis